MSGGGKRGRAIMMGGGDPTSRSGVVGEGARP